MDGSSALIGDVTVSGDDVEVSCGCLLDMSVVKRNSVIL